MRSWGLHLFFSKFPGKADPGRPDDVSVSRHLIERFIGARLGDVLVMGEETFRAKAYAEPGAWNIFCDAHRVSAPATPRTLKTNPPRAIISAAAQRYRA